MQLLEFITNHWPLVVAFVVLLVLLGLSEIRIRLTSAMKVSPQQATQLINKEDALVVDVRDDAAYKKGHVIGARHILPTLLLSDESPLKDKSKTILITCQSGFQASGLGRQLRKLGYERVYYLAGGIENWLSSGLLLSKGK